MHCSIFKEQISVANLKRKIRCGKIENRSRGVESIVRSLTTLPRSSNSLPPGEGGGALPYMGYIGYGFQAVYSRIGYINLSVWV